MDANTQRFAQLPTHSNLKIVSSADARGALFLVEARVLQPVRRRPDDAEKAQISHGQVFIWLDGAKGETGLERWTDGRAWGPSRCRDDFLLYEEKSGDHKLTKCTYTARRNTHGDPGALWHLIAYYYSDETDTLTDVFTDPQFSRYTGNMAPAYFVSSRKDKSRKAKEIPPVVDVSPLSRYDELVASLSSIATSPTATTTASHFPPSARHPSVSTPSQSYHSRPQQHFRSNSYSQQPISYTPTINASYPHRSSPSRASPNSAGDSSMAIVNQAENVSLAGDHQGPYPYPRPTIQTSRFSPDGSSFSPTSTTPTLTSPTSSRRQNHQDLPPLQTSFAQMSTSPLSRKRRSDDDDMMLDSMDQQYAYKKHLPADYHRLPPPSGSSRSFDSGAMHHLYQHAAQSHSRGAIMTFNSSPSPSSSSPGLSPTSPESMASPVDERMRLDGPAGLPAMRGPGGVYHPSSSSSSISPTTPHTYPSYAALPAFAGMGSAAGPGPGGPPASALTAMVGIEGPTAAPIRSREDEKALMQFSKRLW